MISSDTIEEVKSRASLLDLVAETIQLKRQGSGFVGLCPFHAEKSPSFNVREHDNFFHCFGCGKSGNVISFVMESKGLTFPEAIELLADKYGIAVKREGKVQRESSGPAKEDLFRLNTLAQEFYQKNLESADEVTIKYFRDRRITRDAVKEFGIGLAPRGNRLVEALKAPLDQMIASGLVRRNDRGEVYDNLRSRIVFPIFVESKKIAGFGGRIIPALIPKDRDGIPKYINSPESPVYQKSKILFALPQALPFIRETGEVYVVEGYMDVVGLWQVGVKNVVATCGTSLTPEHVKRLSRIAKSVIVMFDGDRAGRVAAARSFDLFLNSGIDVRACFLPEGEDPDSIARSYGANTLAFLKDQPRVDLLDVFLKSLIEEHGVKDISQLGVHALSQVCRDVSGSIQRSKDIIVKDELTKKAARILRIGVDKLESLSSPDKPLKEESQDFTPLEVSSSDFSALPRLDRELLLAVMGDRQRYLGRILSDPLFCQALTPITLQFMQALLECERENRDESRDLVRALLRNSGAGWIDHWKTAHSMVTSKEIDFDKHIEKLAIDIKRKGLQQSSEKARGEASSTLDEELKAKLLNDAIAIEKMARALG